MARTIHWAILLLLAGAAPALAAEDDTAEAKRLYVSGTRHFNLSEYEPALNDFKEGYRRKDDPVFLYNIAQCYRLMKSHEEDALKFYRAYLRQMPHPPNREEVERKIDTLEQAIAMQEKSRSAPPSSTLRPGEASPTNLTVEKAAPPAKKPLYKEWWLWTAVGAVVVVGVGVGLGLGLSSHNSSQTNFPAVDY